MWKSIKNGRFFQGDVLEAASGIEPESCQLIIADPPYFQVVLDEEWDNSWADQDEYLEWTRQWVTACESALKPDGLLYICGQLGKREHVWLHLCSDVCRILQFHDMIIWDRAVGYNERSDSFTPQYEMILSLRKKECAKPFFNKDAVRIPYDQATIETYMKDNRYKDKQARRRHLEKGKYATNLIRVPSLKGNSREKIGHPTQKPLALIEKLVLSGSRENDVVLDPFLGSGTTAAVCESFGRKWIGIEKDPQYTRIIEDRLFGQLL